MKYEDFDMIVGNALREERMKKKLTIRRVGELMKVDNSTVSKWETGTNSMKAKELLRYLEILGLSYTEFFNEIEK